MNPDSFIKYCTGIADEFTSRLNRLRSFVHHNLSSGTANESILRDFLSTHAPYNYGVGQGFICDPFEENSVSKQCDILVYNRSNFPLVYSDGPISVVLPRAARMVIEVKTGLRQRNEIFSAIENIVSAKTLNPYLTGVIFCFQSATIEAFTDALASYPHQLQPELSPTAFILLDKDTVIHNWHWDRHFEKRTDIAPLSYAVREPNAGCRGIAMTCLLSLLFQATESEIYQATVINLLIDVFDHYTKPRTPDAIIGGAHNQAGPDKP